MKGSVTWLRDMTFVAEAESGHAVVVDAGPESDGHNLGMRPLEMVLVGTAGCSAFDVVHILKKGREAVDGCRVEVEATRAESHPRVFTKIHLRYIVSGRNLSRDKVERAVNLSATTYCSASAMMSKTAEISHQVDVIESGSGA